MRKGYSSEDYRERRWLTLYVTGIALLLVLVAGFSFLTIIGGDKLPNCSKVYSGNRFSSVAFEVAPAKPRPKPRNRRVIPAPAPKPVETKAPATKDPIEVPETMAPETEAPVTKSPTPTPTVTTKDPKVPRQPSPPKSDSDDRLDDERDLKDDDGRIGGYRGRCVNN
jgi:hypothetical protein